MFISAPGLAARGRRAKVGAPNGTDDNSTAHTFDLLAGPFEGQQKGIFMIASQRIKSSRMRKIALALVCFVALALSAISMADGQTSLIPSVGPVGDNVQPPIGGVGHDYIHLLSETVNPANG